MSFEFSTGGPSLQDAINSLQNPAWPFMTLKFKKVNGVKKTNYTIDVDPTIYEWITQNLGRDEIQLFFTTSRDPIRSWTPDMGIAMEIMSELGAMSKISTWERISREGITNHIKRIDNFDYRIGDKFISLFEEILTACKFFEPESKYDKVISIAKEAITNKTRDPDTLIYRLAMLIYHYAFNSRALDEFKDWEIAYLNFSQNKDINKKYPMFKQKLSSVVSENKQLTFKTILSFIIGAYVYYKGVKEIDS